SWLVPRETDRRRRTAPLAKELNMPISFRCPQCSARLTAPDRHSGTPTNCPRCRECIRIPTQSASPPATPPLAAPAPKQDQSEEHYLEDVGRAEAPAVPRAPSVSPTGPLPVAGGAGFGVVSLKCVSCGAALDVRPDDEVFHCRYCGSAQAVHREGGVV